MHDAIALISLFYAVPAKISMDIAKVFEEYQEDCLPAVMETFKKSQSFGQNLG